MKKENENFFDIDFKQEKVKTSEKKQNADFFDFSMKPDKKVLKEEKETLDFEASEDVAPSVDAIESAEENLNEIIEETSAETISDIEEELLTDVHEDILDESVAKVQEELDDNNDDDDVIIETPKHSPATEVTSENQEEVQAEASVEKSDESSVEIPVEAPEEDDIIINVVKWGKVAPESQIKTVEPKKSNLVIDLEDGFEIKMCNFRGLSQKENDSDKNIKKN